LAQFLPQRSIANNPAERRDKSFFIARRYAEPAFADLIWSSFNHFTQQIDYSANARRYHGARIRHRFDQREWCAFILRRECDDVERRIKVIGIGPAAHEDHVRIQPQSLSLTFETAAQRTVANHDESHRTLATTSGIDCLEPRHDIQKQLVVFDLRQATNHADEKRVIRNAKLLTKLRPARRVIGKDVEVQSQRNHFDLSRPADSKRLAN